MPLYICLAPGCLVTMTGKQKDYCLAHHGTIGEPFQAALKQDEIEDAFEELQRLRKLNK